MNTKNTNLQSSANSNSKIGTFPKPNGRKEAIEAIKTLQKFMSQAQLSAFTYNMRGEEKQFFFDKSVEMADTMNTMPKTYETDGQGHEAIAHLHYFFANMDWYITERDMEAEQHQAFGLANLGYGGELGYISIEELIATNRIELDMFWSPKKLKEIK